MFNKLLKREGNILFSLEEIESSQDIKKGILVLESEYFEIVKISLEEAEKMNLVLPATIQALKLYEELADKGFENDGTQALIKLWWPEGKIPEKKS